MVVKLRLARLSKRHQPFYNIVVAKDRSARDSKPMEVLGTYNPVPQVPLAVAQDPAPYSSSAQVRRYKDIKLDITRTKYWLGVGAQPSEGVQGILGMLGLWEGKPGTKESLGRKGALGNVAVRQQFENEEDSSAVVMEEEQQQVSMQKQKSKLKQK